MGALDDRGLFYITSTARLCCTSLGAQAPRRPTAVLLLPDRPGRRSFRAEKQAYVGIPFGWHLEVWSAEVL